MKRDKGIVGMRDNEIMLIRGLIELLPADVNPEWRKIAEIMLVRIEMGPVQAKLDEIEARDTARAERIAQLEQDKSRVDCEIENLEKMKTSFDNIFEGLYKGFPAYYGGSK